MPLASAAEKAQPGDDTELPTPTPTEPPKTDLVFHTSSRHVEGVKSAEPPSEDPKSNAQTPIPAQSEALSEIVHQKHQPPREMTTNMVVGGHR